MEQKLKSSLLGLRKGIQKEPDTGTMDTGTMAPKAPQHHPRKTATSMLV
jgi:hypothetical protein